MMPMASPTRSQDAPRRTYIQPPRSVPDRLAALVRASFGHQSRAGLTALVEKIAQVANLDGCILWLPTPGTVLDKTDPKGSLYVGAQWFRGDVSWTTHLQELSSVTGKAMIKGEPDHVYDVVASRKVDHTKPFFKETGTKAFVSVPIEFPLQEPPIAALCGYKQQPGSFARIDIGFLEDCGRLLPDLWRTVLDSVSLHLMEEVSDSLRAVDLGAQEDPLNLEQVRAMFREICNRIADSMLAQEVSIFLRDPLVEGPAQYELQATTNEPFAATGPYPVLGPDDGPPQGLTPWVLFRDQPVSIFDLLHWDSDLTVIREAYPGIVWNDPAGVRSMEEPGARGEPVSFMAVPIPSKTGTLGAVRCCWAKQPPYFYSAAETNLLGRLAVQLSNFWNAWLGQRELANGMQRMRNVQADVAHQLKTPLNSANATLRSLCKRKDGASNWLDESKKVRSAVARARSVTTSMRIYEELHRDGQVALRIEEHPVWKLQELVDEAVDAVKTALDPARNLTTKVEHSGLESALVRVDLELYEQLLYLLLDNAGKYSYPGTRIRVSTGFAGKRKRFAFTVQNASERIPSTQIERLSDRGFRTERAQLWTQEGSGLGLWIAKHIMEAHGGELVLSSVRGGSFEARLLFPA